MEPCFHSKVPETELLMRAAPSSGVFSVFLLIVCMVYASASAEITTLKKQDHLGVGATLAADTKASVTRGDEVKIFLQAVPCYGATIDFQIVKPPLHGTLTPPESLDDHTAVVTYRSRDEGDILHDAFLFRAKSPGHSPSVNCSAEIDILSPPVRVSFGQTSMDFGSVRLSQKVERILLLCNEGRSPARGRLLLPVGFSSPEDATFDIAVGKSLRIPLLFAPREAKTYKCTLASMPEIEGLNLELTGAGLPRFELVKPDSKSCEVKNLTGLPLKISFSGDGRVVLPPDEELPPMGKKSFQFERQARPGRAPSNQNAPVQVTLSDGMSSLDLTLSPPDLKPDSILKVVPLSSTNLGMISNGEDVKINFSLLNLSGYPLQSSWNASSKQGGISSASSMFKMQAGETRIEHLVWAPTRLGDAVLEISVFDKTHVVADLKWKATVRSPTSSLTITAHPSDSDLMNGKDPDRDSDAELSKRLEASPPPTPPVSGATCSVRSSWTGQHELAISWDALPDGNLTPRISEVSMLLTGPLELKKEISTPSDYPTYQVKFQKLEYLLRPRLNGRDEGVIRDLGPGWKTMDLSLLTPQGTSLYESQFQLFIPPDSSWSLLTKGVLTLVSLFALGFLIHRWRKRSS